MLRPRLLLSVILLATLSMAAAQTSPPDGPLDRAPDRVADRPLDRLLDDVERETYRSSSIDVERQLEALQSRLDDATPRQRHRFELLRIRILARSGRLEEAADRSTRLVESIESMEPDLAQRALNLATNVLVVDGRFDEGFRYFRRALDHAPAVADPQMRADTYSVAAEFYDRIGETATAVSYADQALALARQHGLDRQACIALERGGRALLHSRGLVEAAARLNSAIITCERAGESVFKGQAELGLAVARYELGDREQASELMQQASTTFEQAEFPEGLLELQVLNAEWALEAGDLERLEQLLAQIGPQLDRPGELDIRARAWQLRAERAERRGDRYAALDAFRRAMTLRQERSERQRTMRIALLINEQDTAARSQELTLLRDRNRALELEHERRQQADLGLIYGGSGALVAAVLVIVLLFKTGSDRKRFQRMSQRDGLTGLLNHTRFFQLAHQAYQRCRQQERPFVIVVADIDLFKQINDEHGHLLGDAILQRTGACLRETFGDDALIGRLGGEEFGIALPGEDTDAAVARIEHLRAVINESRADGEPSITLSFGVAERGRERDLDALYARADQALYDAKDAGRNRVVTVARLVLDSARFTT